MQGPIAVVGAGLVGAGWAIVFARAGHTVRVHDADAGVRARALAGIAANVRDLKRFALIDDADAVMARQTVVDDLGAAVADVRYVQESVFETVAAKQPVYMALDQAHTDRTPLDRQLHRRAFRRPPSPPNARPARAC